MSVKRGKGRKELKRSVFPCRPVNCECWWKKIQTKKMAYFWVNLHSCIYFLFLKYFLNTWKAGFLVATMYIFSLVFKKYCDYKTAFFLFSKNSTSHTYPLPPLPVINFRKLFRLPSPFSPSLSFAPPSKFPLLIRALQYLSTNTFQRKESSI